MQQNKSINKELFKFLANQKPYARVDINGGEGFPACRIGSTATPPSWGRFPPLL